MNGYWVVFFLVVVFVAIFIGAKIWWNHVPEETKKRWNEKYEWLGGEEEKNEWDEDNRDLFYNPVYSYLLGNVWYDDDEGNHN